MNEYGRDTKHPVPVLLFAPNLFSRHRGSYLKLALSLKEHRLLLHMLRVAWLSLFAAPSAAMSLHLRYFDARGAAEVTRVLLAISGTDYADHRFAIERTDAGFSTPEFTSDKESGALAANLNRAPVLLVDEQPIGQSHAIERYIATQGGLMGATPLEAAIIDSVAEHVRDVKDAQGRKGFGMFSRDKSDEEKAEAKAEWYDTDMPSWLQRIEACVEPVKSIVCGDVPSYAAVCIWQLLREGTDEDLALVAKAAEGCDALNSIADAVATHPRVADWVSKRPVTMM